MELFTDVVRQYRSFAVEAEDSPCFARWATALADDPEVVAWVATLPQLKRQPNLVFAAARLHGVPAPGPYDALRRALLDDRGQLRTTILTRATQTNEAGRLATLLPAFALAAEGRPVALLEIGASAGLTLHPDRWSYAWATDGGTVRLSAGPDAPVLGCRVTGPAPLPTSLPEIVWRGGLDLDPLDVEDEDDVAWLEMLVWPEHEDRRARLRSAVALAREDPPRLVRGDLRTDLPGLLDRAREDSGGARVVVFHSAVLAYLDPDARRAVADGLGALVAEGACRWVSNEGRQVLPQVTATGPAVPDDRPTFVLGLDGRALAWTHGHGRSMHWVA